MTFSSDETPAPLRLAAQRLEPGDPLRGHVLAEAREVANHDRHARRVRHDVHLSSVRADLNAAACRGKPIE